MLDLTVAYENHLKNIKRASDNTVASYMRDIRQYGQWLLKFRNKEIADANREDVQAFLTHLMSQGRSSSTLNRNLASLKNLYIYLNSAGFIMQSPIVDIAVEPIEKKLPQILTGREIELLLAQPSLNDAKGIRDKAMLELLYATGMRVTELIDLNFDDVNMEMGVIKCANSKKARMIPLYRGALNALELYLRSVRSAMVADLDETALFVNVAGHRMTRQGFWKILKTYQASAQIEKDITPHTLRHSFAVHLLENGADLTAIKEMMGHSDISSTQVYSQLVNQKIRTVYEKCHPKA